LAFTVRVVAVLVVLVVLVAGLRRTAKCYRETDDEVACSTNRLRRPPLELPANLRALLGIVFGAAIVLTACSGGGSSVPRSFDSVKRALGEATVAICYEESDPTMTFGPIVGATDARSYFLVPCPNGGKVAVGAFPNETLRDKGLQYLLGLDKASFTPGQSGPIWKRGWRVGRFAVVIDADTPPAATKQVDRAMNALGGERVRLTVVPGGGS
jgi:hypothetical protein